jgi:hypothetical protein
MFPPDPRAAALPDAVCDLVERARDLQDRRAALEAEETDLVIEVERKRMTGARIFRDTEAFLRNATGIARATAHTRTQVARQLLNLPAMREALAAGRVTFDHARALAHHADSPNRDEVLDRQAELTQWAIDLSADDYRDRLATFARDLDDKREALLSQAERRHRRRKVRRTVTKDGLRRTIMDLDEETDAIVYGAVRDVVAEMNRADQKAKIPLDRRRSSGQKWADAFAEVARRSRAADIITKHRARPTILAITEMSVLWDQLRVNGVCELEDGTQLTARQLRRMACEADIIPMVLDTNGVPMDVGRAYRLATPKQRLALRVLHSTCACEGCDVPFDWCEIHHLRPWDKLGRTNLDNLVPLCEYHHHLVHDLDGEVRSYELLPDRTLRLKGLPLPVTPRRRESLVDRLKRPPDLVPARG